MMRRLFNRCNLLKTRTIVKWSAFTLIIAITTALLAGGTLLGSESGRLWLTHRVVNTLNQSTPLQIKITELSAPRLGRWQARHISVYLDQQLWIVVDELNLKWQPLALLDRSIVIEQIQADSFSLHKLPPSPDVNGQKASEEKTGNVPFFVNNTLSKIPYIQLEKLTIQSLNLYGFRPTKTDENSLSYTINANAHWLKHSPLHIDIEALGLDAIPAAISLQIQSSDWAHATLVGSLREAAGGFFGELLQLPKEHAIDAGFDVTVIKLADQYDIDIQQLSLPLAQRNLIAQGRIALLPEKSTVLVNNLALAIDDTHHTINGSWVEQQLDFVLGLNKFPLDIVKLWQAAVDNGEVTAQLNINGSATQPRAQGSITANTVYKNLPITGDFVGSISKSLVNIEYLKAALAQSEITALGKLDIASDTSDIEIAAKKLNLAHLELFGIHLPATLNATIISAEARLNGPAHDLRGNLTLLANGEYEAQPFSLESQLVKDNTKLFINNATLKVADGSASLKGNLNPQTLDANFSIDAISVPLSLMQLAGITLPETLTGQVNTRFNLSGNLRNPTVAGDAQLQGVYQTIPFSLDASGHHKNNDSQLKTLRVSAFDEQVFTASGHYRAGQFDVRARAKNLPSQLFSALGWTVQPGSFNADIQAQGSLNTAAINGNLSYGAVLHGYDDEGEETDINFIWNLDIATSAETISLASTFTRDDHQPGELTLKIPTQPYIDYALRGKSSVEYQDLPLQASLKGSLNLQTVSFLLNPDLHRLTGELNTDINMSGTLARPKIEGTLRAYEARYENPITGTLIEHINCFISTEKITLTIETCQATDGGSDDNSGKYALIGTVQLPFDQSFGHVALTVQTQGAYILRRPDIESEATGEITLSGDFTSLLASGNLEVAPFTAVFDANLSSGIPSIKVEEVQTQQDLYGLNDKKKPASSRINAMPELKFDLVITANNQAFLRGHGIEAELQGQIDIHGDSKKPVYEGEFKTVRGIFNLFNKKFELEQGQVNFANNAISLTITGAYEKNGQRIQADLTGTNDNMTLNFSAIPDIPEDEILAFIIFGKPLQQITPFEAIQLASAVQTLRSGGSGFFDPIGRARDLLGVDTLSIESAATEDGQNGVNVGIGKYLNERVYLELERTPNPSQPWKGNLEIELTPSINLESSTGGQTGIEGAELKWKRDY